MVATFAEADLCPATVTLTALGIPNLGVNVETTLGELVLTPVLGVLA